MGYLSIYNMQNISKYIANYLNALKYSKLLEYIDIIPKYHNGISIRMILVGIKVILR